MNQTPCLEAFIDTKQDSERLKTRLTANLGWQIHRNAVRE